VNDRATNQAWELIQQSQCLFIKWDLEARITFANRYALEFLQAHEQDLLGRSVFGTLLPETPEQARTLESCHSRLLSGLGHDPLIAKGGMGPARERWVSWTLRLVMENGGSREVLATGHDVTDLRKRTEELKRSEAKYRRIISTTSEGFVLLDKDMCILDANDILARNLGYVIKDVLGTTPDNYFTKETMSLYLAGAERLNAQDHLQFEADLVAKDGRLIPHLVTLSVLRDDDGGIAGYVSFLANLTELRRARQECRRAEMNYRRLYENLPQGIFRSTLSGRVLDINPALAEMMGFSSPEEALTESLPSELFYEDLKDRERMYEALVQKGMLVNHEVKVRRRDGVPMWILLNVRLTTDESGEALVEGIVVDDTARKLAEEELRRSEETFRYLAQHDNLTGLFNTRFLYHRLNEMIASAETAPFSVVFMDMDNFKGVVDTFGHLNGSRALQEVAQTIRDCLQQPSFGVAYGGDEFVLVLPGHSKAQALAKVEEVRLRMRETIYLAAKGYNLSLTASFGVSTYPDDATALTELLGSADKAMFQIKTAGKDGVMAIGD
jgi:diguanylate cyclase (GGDEF)-like protein/PAS domain S-box-containing protein